MIVMFYITAVDDFGRKFNSYRSVPSVDFEYMIAAKRDIYRYLFDLMTRNILREMGTAVYAEWKCEMRKWDETSTEV